MQLFRGIRFCVGVQDVGGDCPWVFTVGIGIEGDCIDLSRLLMDSLPIHFIVLTHAFRSAHVHVVVLFPVVALCVSYGSSISAFWKEELVAYRSFDTPVLTGKSQFDTVELAPVHLRTQ